MSTISTEAKPEPKPTFDHGTATNCYHCTRSCGSVDWCLGCCCMYCLQYKNADNKYLNRNECQDCCLSLCSLHAGCLCLGAWFVNNWQRKDLQKYGANIPEYGGLAPCICASCVACETARALEHLKEKQVPASSIDTTRLLTGPVVVQQPGGN